MNVDKPDSFKKFVLSIEFESPEEASAFYSLFNYGPILDAIESAITRDDALEIRRIIDGELKHQGLFNFYGDFHNKLTNIRL